MSGIPKPSIYRALAGGGLLLLALGGAFWLLPDASCELGQKQRAAREARGALDAERARLEAVRAQAEGLLASQARMERLLQQMPQEPAGRLQWKLSSRLHELARKWNVRIQAVKYGAPTREASRGTDLEALDVEFVASAVYQSLKPFVFDLESSELPFGVSSAKLEEGPEGARLTVTLRAFRRTGTAPVETPQEGA